MNPLKKIQCSFCGQKNPATFAMCSRCGNVLGAEDGTGSDRPKKVGLREKLEFHSQLRAMELSGRTLRVSQVSKYRFVLTIAASIAPYSLAPLIGQYLGIILTLLLPAMLSGLIAMFIMRFDGVRIIRNRGINVVSQGMPHRILYNYVSRVVVDEAEDGRRILIFLKYADDPITLEFDSRLEFDHVAKHLETGISPGSKGYGVT